MSLLLPGLFFVVVHDLDLDLHEKINRNKRIRVVIIFFSHLLFFFRQAKYLEFDDSGQLSTNIYDKRDDFNFKIINFPNMCSNIPASPAYGV